MLRIAAFLVAITAARMSAADDRLIPLFTGIFDGRSYRTTVDLRSRTTEQCRFELRAVNGESIHAIETVEAGVPLVLDEFAGELRLLATTVRVSCTGSVDVHSSIHSSHDGGATYDEGALFRAAVPTPLAVGQTVAVPITGDVILAEVAGLPASVATTITAFAVDHVSHRRYELAPLRWANA